MDDKRVIHLMLRAEGDGARGDALFSYAPGDKDYDKILRHLGGLSPGQSKPVPPFPADRNGAPKAQKDRLEITAAQAKQRGLTPRRIALDLGNHGLSASPLDEPDRYLHLSGPPGGPLGLELREQPTLTDQDLIAGIRKRHQVEAKAISAIGTTQIQGRPWRVVAFVAGEEGFSRAIHWVADRDGLTLHAWIDWRNKPLPADAVPRLTTTQPFDHIIRTLEID